MSYGGGQFRFRIHTNTNDCKGSSNEQFVLNQVFIFPHGLGGRRCDRMVVGFNHSYLCNQCLSPLTLWVRTPLRRGVLDITLCDQLCQWLAAGRCFPLVSSTNITKILLKVALHTITLTQWFYAKTTCISKIKLYIWSIALQLTFQPSSLPSGLDISDESIDNTFKICI